MSMPSHRFAIYWSPDARSPIGRFGRDWLGYDAENQTEIGPSPVDGLTRSDIKQITQEPGRYGFHGTLKPPFRLRDGFSTENLFESVAAFAESQPPIKIDGFEIRSIGRFIAFSPVSGRRELSRLAAACVSGLDDLRAPLTDSEMARRRKRPLTPYQDSLLRQWGYPYVMDEFRFHLTLTDALDDGMRPELVDRLTEAAGPALDSTAISDISVFAEPEPGARFRLLRRFSLTGNRTDEGSRSNFQ